MNGPENLPQELDRTILPVSPEVEQGAENLHIEVITDQQGFERSEFNLDADGSHTLVFRGREELPSFDDADTTATVILSQTEKPQATPETEFKSWSTETGSHGSAEKTRFIGSCSPEGVVETTIGLLKTGVIESDPNKLSTLKQLQQKLKDQNYDEQVLGYFDTYYAAVTVSTGEKGLSFEPNEQGLFELVQALAGDSAAAEIVAQKQAFVEQHDAEEAKTEDGTRIKEPGESLSSEELDLLRSKHFVAVHTGYGAPVEQPNGSLALKTRSGHQRHAPMLPQRNTLHWSLNHPVVTHIMGSFDARPFTIVVPLAELVDKNGAPRMINGVDTYFSTNPGENVELPPSAVIIETHQDEKRPAFDVQAERISIRSNGWDKDSLRQLVEYFATNFPADERDSRSPQSRLASSLAWSGVFPKSEAAAAGQEQLWSLISERMDPHLVEVDRKTGYSERAVEQATVDLIVSIIDGDVDLVDYPELQPIITEATRISLVKNIIGSKFGGRIVHSDAMSAYIEDQKFQDDVYEVGRRVGIIAGLHAYMPESRAEEAYTGLIMSGSEGEREVTKDESLQYGGLEAVLEGYGWDKADAYKNNGSIVLEVLQDAPKQTRRTILATGMLTLAKKPRPVFTSF